MCKYVLTCIWIEVLVGNVHLQVSSPTSTISVGIHASPKHESFNPGQNVTLTCQVQSGGPADVINWFKENRPIRIQNDSNSSQWGEISLININRNDAGEYNCTVWKREESDSDEFYLHVNGPPVIRLPEEIYALEGKDTVIICKADGWPPPIMTWRRDDVYLRNDSDYEIRVQPILNQATLVIRSINRAKHEDHYTCEARNALGEAEESVPVSVEEDGTEQSPPAPVKILVKSHYVIASNGSNITLKCEAINTFSMAAMCVWKFNGTQLFYDQPPSNLKLSCVEFANRKTMTLKIHNVSRRDAGLYECGVSNGPGNAWNTITLLVGEKDDFQNISTNSKTVQATTNSQVQLKCITAHPAFLEVETFWMFQSTTLLNGTDPRYKIRAFHLESSDITRTVAMSVWISNISVSDFGNYSCVVNTSLGSSSESIFLVQIKREKDVSADGDKENSPVLIIIFPLVAGVLLLALTMLVFLRKIQRKRLDLKLQEKAASGEFRYDVFVTFSSKDRQWVSNKLTPLLERQRLKYCIHSRDFELGRALVDNMAESVYASRKVLAVMSKNYLESKFCRGELEMALYRSKVGRDGSLLVVTIDGLKKKKLPKALRECTFVDYHSDAGHSSWEKKLMRFLVQTDDDPNVFNTKL